MKEPEKRKNNNSVILIAIGQKSFKRTSHMLVLFNSSNLKILGDKLVPQQAVKAGYVSGHTGEGRIESNWSTGKHSNSNVQFYINAAGKDQIGGCQHSLMNANIQV